MYDGYIDVVGRVGPGDEPMKWSGPKSKDMALEERCDEC
jgi:hypothetical protein